MFHRRNHQASRRPAFTLVELMIVVTIIGILVALLLPAIAAALARAANVECMSNLQQIAKASLTYSHQNNETVLPAIIKYKDGTASYWCTTLVRGGYLAAVDTSKASGATSPENGVLRCPRSEPGLYPVTTTAPRPDDLAVQGTVRYVTSTNPPVGVDSSYFWNGYTGSDSTCKARFPSLFLDLNDTLANQRTQTHALSDVRLQSSTVMAADGILFDAQVCPARIATRHPGNTGNYRRTNIVYFDAHSDYLDRYPATNNNWASEVCVDTTQVGIMSRSSTGVTKLDGGPPFFTIPAR
jgi:prepilin-type N-terminal cleavage/methylation domain-containing protein